MVILSVMAAEAGTTLSVRSFEELTSVSISEDGIVSTRMRPNYNVVTGYPSKTTDWQRSYFFVKSNRSAFDEPPRSGSRVLWNPDMVGHPNLATYAEDWKQSARTVVLQKQDHSEQKEINRARSMKQLPDLSRIMAEKATAKKGASESGGGSSGPRKKAAASTEQTRTGGSSKQKERRKDKERDADVREVPTEDADDKRTPVEEPQKKTDKKKRKRTDDGGSEAPPSGEVPKKRMRKKDFVFPRPSSVSEGELRDLAPPAADPEVRTLDDDENETLARRLRRREGRVVEFNRELPLPFYPEECGRLTQLIKGGPVQLPPVKDLIFKNEYEHAAFSSVKSQGDWNVLVEKYDTALRRAWEQIREGEEARKKAKLGYEEALRAATRERVALRKSFNEQRTADTADLKVCKDSMKDLETVVDKLKGEKAILSKRELRKR
ncbi:hypothetical protein Bca52824_035632 [Brassica carinata]|uniref:Uncharacterized protein n=1 Tax=Brassica carinata TaxID=52824 RepID=A0A8X7V0S1_BRACI|nr:hypothetical protein Bca52824_035632 [Brassica carinata]